MATYNPLSGEGLFDVAAKLYGDTPAGVQDLLTLNSGINVDSDLFGTSLTYTPGLKRTPPVIVTQTQTSPTATYKTRYLQSVYDLAIQLYGDVSKIGNLIKLFSNLDSNITLGFGIDVPLQSDPIAQYFSTNNIIVATDLTGNRDLTADLTTITVDSDQITADQTIY